MLKTINGFSQTDEAAQFIAAIGRRVIEGVRLFPAPQPGRIPKGPQTPSL
jgi:hypothetical protein